MEIWKFNQLNIKRFLWLLLFCNAVSNLAAQTNITLKKDEPFVLGKTSEIYSKELGEKRTLNIYLPTGYTPTDTTKYAVIYLLDGSADEDFIHIAGLVQFANFSWVNLLPPTIVVGIANVDRRRDLTFTPNDTSFTNEFPTSGHSAEFIAFIEKELQPFVRKHYQTNDTVTLIGQSLGGLLATEILIKKTALFTNYIIISPSLWWDNESLLPGKSASKIVNAIAGNVYVGVGKEGKIMVNDSKRLFRQLKKNNSVPGKLHYEYFKKEDHASIMHIAVYNALKAFKNSKSSSK